MRTICTIFLIVMLSMTANALEVDDLQLYLNSMNSLQATFSQTNQGGEKSYGELFLKKGLCVVLQYNEPDKILLLADKGGTLIYDYSIKETTHSAKKPLITSVLLNKLSLKKDFITNTLYKDDLYSTFSIVKPNEATAIIKVNNSTMQIISVELTNEDGEKVLLEFDTYYYNKPISSEICEFKEQSIYRSDRNKNR